MCPFSPPVLGGLIPTVSSSFSSEKSILGSLAGSSFIRRGARYLPVEEFVTTLLVSTVDHCLVHSSQAKACVSKQVRCNRNSARWCSAINRCTYILIYVSRYEMCKVLTWKRSKERLFALATILRKILVPYCRFVSNKGL